MIREVLYFVVNVLRVDFYIEPTMKDLQTVLLNVIVENICILVTMRYLLSLEVRTLKFLITIVQCVFAGFFKTNRCGDRKSINYNLTIFAVQ